MTEQKTKLVPKRRFKEFQNTRAWEQRKVGEMASETYGGGTPKTSEKDYWDGDIPWIQSSNLTDGNVVDVVINKRISKAGLNNSATKLVPPNSIAIITRVGVGKLVFIPFEYTTSQDFLSLSGLQTEPWFSVYALYKKLQNELNAVQGTSIKGITKDELLSKVIMIPTDIEEQAQIGRFFKQLDNLITLHQRKLEKTKALKTAYLSEMFPAEGERKPKRRFARFTDDWEQRKLNDKVNIIGTGKSKFTSNNKKTEGKQYAVLGSTSVISYDDEYDYSGDFILTARVGANAGDLYRYSGNVKISDNTVFLQGKELDFVFYSLTKFNLKKLAFGTGQPLIKSSELSSLELMFPSQYEEEKQVGDFFNHLDNLITLHQRKLEKLQNIKKAYLNEMFV